MASILFCDDDTSSLKIYAKAAEILGHRPLLAETGRQAIQLAASQKPDLIMVDLYMPDLDGLEVLEALHRDPETEGIPVLLLSAGATGDLRSRANASGAQGFVVKPLSLGKLMGLIDQHINERDPEQHE